MQTRLYGCRLTAPHRSRFSALAAEGCVVSYVDRLKADHHKLGLRVWVGLSAGVVTLLLVSLGALSSIRQVPRWGLPSPAPRLELSTTYLDLGEGKPNEVMRGIFLLRNTGTAALKFSIGRSCGCAELKPSRGTVPAGVVACVRRHRWGLWPVVGWLRLQHVPQDPTGVFVPRSVRRVAGQSRRAGGRFRSKIAPR